MRTAQLCFHPRRLLSNVQQHLCGIAVMLPYHGQTVLQHPDRHVLGIAGLQFDVDQFAGIGLSQQICPGFELAGILYSSNSLLQTPNQFPRCDINMLQGEFERRVVFVCHGSPPF
jgi:hypothetical protein